MAFTTKLDFSTNRQVKQYPENITYLSGGTFFGVPYSYLPTGPNTSSSAITQTLTNVVSTFSGNSGTTNYTWYDSRMSLGSVDLSALTPSNSATTQNTGQIYTSGNTSTTVDGYNYALNYTGVSFDLTVTAMVSLGGGNYSGSVHTNNLYILSAGTLDYSGRTIWADVSGITRTQDLIISNSPTINYVWTCIGSDGKGGWRASSGSSSNYWTAGTGTGSVYLISGGNSAGGNYALAEGLATSANGNYSHTEGYTTIAGGFYSHAEGYATSAGGTASHSEGNSCLALENYTHVEGNNTKSSGQSAHAEGEYTTASGLASHSEGKYTTASGLASHASGSGSTASGHHSFVHGSGSTATGIGTIVLGDGISGSQVNYTYVNSLNVKTIGSSAYVNDIRVDGSGNLTTNTSDVRLKENIKPLNNSLDKIKKLNGVTYQWKDRIAGGDDVKIGFIAQEVAEVEPSLVFTNKVDGYMGIHIDGVIPMLVEAVKELSNGVKSNGNVYLETQSIFAEDNNIDLNYSGTPETAIGGGIRVLHGINQEKHSEFLTDENGNWTTNNYLIPNGLIIPNYTPTSSDDNYGIDGMVTRDSNYLYVKNNATWGRISFEKF
jgi:Chaperone of endosialidase